MGAVQMLHDTQQKKRIPGGRAWRIERAHVLLMMMDDTLREVAETDPSKAERVCEYLCTRVSMPVRPPPRCAVLLERGRSPKDAV